MAHDTNQFGVWQPWNPQEVASFFSELDAPWWIAGGWALDLFILQYPQTDRRNVDNLMPPYTPENQDHSAKKHPKRSSGFALGQQTREHDDIDIQVLRRDQQAIRAMFGAWDIQEADSGTYPEEWPFREWESGILLNAEVHDVWCRPKPTDPWALQLMIADTDGDDWLCRRDARIFRPITTIGLKTVAGIPYLAPEIQLLYKAKTPRPKDEADFARTLPYLDRERRQWLVQALTMVHPNHPWLLKIEK